MPLRKSASVSQVHIAVQPLSADAKRRLEMELTPEGKMYEV